MCAACNGHAHVVKTLLQHGARVDVPTKVSVLLHQQLSFRFGLFY